MHGMSGKRTQRKRRSAGPSVRVIAVMRTLFSLAMLYKRATRARRAVASSPPVRVASARKAAKRARKEGKCPSCGRRSRAGSLGALSVGATTLGALAVGAFAIGALAIRALAIRRLTIKRASISELDVRDLKVGRLEVDELLVHQETHSQPPTPVENP
jgi:hypothetical protein